MSSLMFWYFFSKRRLIWRSSRPSSSIRSIPDLIDLLLIGETSTSMSSESFMFSRDFELLYPMKSCTSQQQMRKSEFSDCTNIVSIHINIIVAVMIVIFYVIVDSFKFIKWVLFMSMIIISVDRVCLIVVDEFLLILIHRRLIMLCRLNDGGLSRVWSRLKIQILGVFICENQRFKINFPFLTSKSDPLTISTNCRHFSINIKFWLDSNNPG